MKYQFLISEIPFDPIWIYIGMIRCSNFYRKCQDSSAPIYVVGGQRNLFVFKLYENTKWFQSNHFTRRLYKHTYSTYSMIYENTHLSLIIAHNSCLIWQNLWESGQVYCKKHYTSNKLQHNCNCIHQRNYQSSHRTQGLLPQYNGRASVATGQNIK